MGITDAGVLVIVSSEIARQHHSVYLAPQSSACGDCNTCYTADHEWHHHNSHERRKVERPEEVAAVKPSCYAVLLLDVLNYTSTR